MNFDLEPVAGRNLPIVSVSNSEIQQFKECKRKWYLGTYLGLQPKAKKFDGPLALGTRIHHALEMYYTDDRDAIEVYAKDVDEARYELIVNEYDTTNFDKEAELGRIMLEGYFEWLEETGADSDIEVISAEEVLRLPILDGTAELIGKLDMRVRRKADGVRLVMDHKTAASMDQVTKIAHMAEQFKMYHLLEILKDGEENRCDGSIYNILKKVKRTASAKPPFYERVEVRHNKHTMRAFWTQVHGVIQQIVYTRQMLDQGYDHNHVAYPTPTNDCSWKCPFYAVCPLMDDGSAADRMIDDYYTQGDPYARYEKGEE